MKPTLIIQQKMPVAETILAQLGGKKFIMMTGARNFVGSEDSLSFRLPGTMTRNRINHVRITLDPSDTYSLTFSAIRKMKAKIVSEHSEVYSDNLCELFRDITGLETRMPRIVGI